MIYLDVPGSLASVEVEDDDDTPGALWYAVPAALVMVVLFFLCVAQTGH